MPPNVSSASCRALVTQLTPLLSPVSPKLAKLKLSHKHNQGTRRMNVTRRKLIPLLIFVLSSFSIVRLLKITTITSSSSPLALLDSCSTSSSACSKTKSPPQEQGPSTHKPPSSAKTRTITKKELRFLSRMISRRAPCNLLVFGLEHRYLRLSMLNVEGNTIFLEDDQNKISRIQTNLNNTQFYKVEYQTAARKAYSLLKHARKSQDCSPGSGMLPKESKCKLALKELPQVVYDLKWDVVVVDGPSGDGADVPGRMGAIYTAGILARTGNVTDVVVHDADRMIEKWFSWEFLCDENLTSSKGKFWHFRIVGGSNSTKFCST